MVLALPIPDLDTTLSRLFLNSPTLIHSMHLHIDFGIKIKENISDIGRKTMQK